MKQTVSAEPASYQILVAGHLDRRREACLDGWCLEHLPEGATRLTGPVRDMAELRGVLNRLFDWHAVLLEVRRKRGNEADSG